MWKRKDHKMKTHCEHRKDNNTVTSNQNLMSGLKEWDRESAPSIYYLMSRDSR